MTLGYEFSLFMHVDERLTYTQIEAALTDAGLENFSITRNYGGGTNYDIQVIVRGDEQLDAVDTVRALADALEDLDGPADPAPGDEEPDPDPQEDPEPPTE